MFAKHTVVYHGVRSAASLSSPHHGTATDTTWQHMTDPDTHAEKKAASGSSNSSSNNNNDTTDDRRGGGATKIRLIKLESQSIDMRQLNRYLPFANPDGGAWKQGWDVQPKPYSKDAPLNVFVLPHSHCDPGWIKTFDEYFQQQTKHILTTVVTALQLNPKRKFIWAEISYFEWWYREQEEPVKQAVKLLLQRNQLEFVTGGWVQPDEANTELYAMEVQLQEGHDWIKETFGEEYIPQFGWSIDPFGYSPTMAYLLEKYGFKGMLIQRVHYAVKKELAQKQHLEFMWR
jgi:alpha-mannosidase II